MARVHLGCPKNGHLVRIFDCHKHRGQRNYIPFGELCRGCGAFILTSKPSLAQDLAYLAGLVDGEGTIGLARRQRGADDRLVGFNAYIKAVNTNRSVIDWCLDNFGGHSRHTRGKGRRKTLWGWEVNGLKAVKALLDQIQPFLIVKAQHAQIIQDYWATGDYRGGSQKGGGDQRIPVSVIAERQRLATELTKLNGGPRPWGKANRFLHTTPERLAAAVDVLE